LAYFCCFNEKPSNPEGFVLPRGANPPAGIDFIGSNGVFIVFVFQNRLQVPFFASVYFG
jgi:hypothetical protein